MELAIIVSFITTEVCIIAFIFWRLLVKRNVALRDKQFLAENTQLRDLANNRSTVKEDLKKIFDAYKDKHNLSDEKFYDDFYGGYDECWIRLLKSEDYVSCVSILTKRTIYLLHVLYSLEHNITRRQQLFNRGLLHEAQMNIWSNFNEDVLMEIEEMKKIADLVKKDWGKCKL